MTFLHLSVLAGISLAFLPIVLHLLAKRQPTHIVFPALRFVRQTAVTAQRGWKVRHWLLLAMRILLLGLLAFLFAGPRVHSEMLASAVGLGLLGVLAAFATTAAALAYSLRRPKHIITIATAIAGFLWLGTVVWGATTFSRGKSAPLQSQGGPIAVAFIVDTSPTMGYRANNESRLEQAKHMANWLIERLPQESQAAVILSEQGARLQSDMTATKRQIDKLTVEGGSVSIPQRVRSAVELVRSSKLDRREVYVITDLMAASWRDADQAGLPQLLATDPNVLLQIVDVGLEKNQNWSLANAKVSQQVALPGGTVEIQADVIASRDAGDDQLTVDLFSEPIDVKLPILRNGKVVVPEKKLVQSQIIDIASGKTSVVRFLYRDLSPGTHHAMLKLTRPDPLEHDNQAHLAIDVRPQGKTLLVGDDASALNALKLIFAPSTETDTDDASQMVAPFRLDVVDFSRFACVCLLDPPSLAPSTVEKISKFVEEGGGLWMILGSRFETAEALMLSANAQLLPGRAARITRRPEDDRSTYLVPVQVTHPVFYPLEDSTVDAPWSRYSVQRHWDIEDLAPSASTLIRYTVSGKPALIEQSKGLGKIITLTTPYPEVQQMEQRATWNDLFTTIEPWEVFGVVRGIAQYLSGSGRYQLNYHVGQTAVLENDTSVFPDRYELFSPTDEVVRIDASIGALTYPYTKFPGAYRLRGMKGGLPTVRGFAVQLSEADILLDRVSIDNLDLTLGRGQYSIAKDKNQIESSIGEARFGRELYPFLMVIVAGLVLAEQAMSMRFYPRRAEAA